MQSIKITDRITVLIAKGRVGMMVGLTGWSLAVCRSLDGRWCRRWLLLPICGHWSGPVRRVGERFTIRRYWVPYFSLTLYRIH